MRWTTTLILILLVLVGWWVMKYLQENEPEPPALRERLIDDEIMREFEQAELSLFSKEIVKIVRQPGGKFEMEFGRTRAGDRWIYKDSIDLDLALQFLQAVDGSLREGHLGEADEDLLLRFNLDPANPKYSLKVTGAGRSQEIHFGADDPSTPGAIMAHDVDENRVFRVGRQVANMLDLNMLDWRDKRVFTLDKQSVDLVQVLQLREMDGRERDPPTEITAQRSGRDLWTVSDGVNEYKADTNKVQGLIQRLCTLRIFSFKAQDFHNPELVKLTGLPDDPVANVNLGSGSATEVLLLGLEVTAGQTAGILHLRDENMTFAIEKQDAEKILATTVDSLRHRRLAPAFETSLVALQSHRPDGVVNYRVERAEKNPRGPWAILDETAERGPGVYEGAGEFSWPQLIADLDRLEVLEFLPSDGAFTPEVVVRVEWMNKPVIRDLEFQLARRGDRVLARASDRPDELLVVPELLWEVAHLPIARYRERSVLSDGKNFGETIRRLRIRGERGLSIDISKSEAREVFSPRIENLSDVTEAISLLYSLSVDAIHLEDEAPEDTGLDDPRLVVEITTTQGQHTLEFGAEDPDGTRVYARVFPKFEGLVVEVPLLRVRDLLALDE